MAVVRFSSRKLYRWISEEVKTLLARSVALRSSEKKRLVRATVSLNTATAEVLTAKTKEKVSFPSFFLKSLAAVSAGNRVLLRPVDSGRQE